MKNSFLVIKKGKYWSKGSNKKMEARNPYNWILSSVIMTKKKIQRINQCEVNNKKKAMV